LNSPLPSFSFIFPLPHSWNSSSRYTFSIVYLCARHLYRIHYLHPFLTSPQHWYQPPPNRTCLAVLFSNFVTGKKWHFCLRKLHREFPCDITMYKCIITWIGSSLLFFSFLPLSALWWFQQV
jgi:hypothetical protein